MNTPSALSTCSALSALRPSFQIRPSALSTLPAFPPTPPASPPSLPARRLSAPRQPPIELDPVAVPDAADLPPGVPSLSTDKLVPLLRARLLEDLPYTNLTSRVTVALNPFQLVHANSDQALAEWRGKRDGLLLEALVDIAAPPPGKKGAKLTSASPLSLNYLVGGFVKDCKIVGLCGETSFANARASWMTIMQVYEYFISHRMAKAFESLFGVVTCLPGCFSMYRLHTLEHKPVLISDAIIAEYGENEVETLHVKHFPRRVILFDLASSLISLGTVAFIVYVSLS
ncbi:hypothetical protein JCM10207_008027 [Rhodosporidiobolus poonsookiae]